MHYFIDRLLSCSEGRIIVANALDGIELGLYDEEFVRTVFFQWRETYQNVRNNIGSPNKILVNAFELMKENQSSSKFNEFLMRCKKQSRIYNKADGYVTIMSLSTLFQVIHNKDVVRLMPYLKIDYEEDVIGSTRLAIENEGGEECIQLEIDARLGGHKGIFWFTEDSLLRRNLLQPIKSTSNSDQLCASSYRDYLGLYHIPNAMYGHTENSADRNKKHYLVALKIPRNCIDSCKTGRPTFVDAGNHLRFKVRADSYKKRMKKALGHTVDLNRFASKEKDIDGCSERISFPIHAKTLGKFYIKMLGYVDARSDNEIDGHRDFSNYLMKRHGGDLNLKKKLIQILKM